MGRSAVLEFVLTHHSATLCLLAALLGASPSYAESTTSEAEPAPIEPSLELALHALPPGIRTPIPEEKPTLAVEYTVDAALEAQVRAILAKSHLGLAQVVVLDPATGEVFAYVASDPLEFPATRAYPMASLMKVVTAAAVLREKPAAVRRSCRYLGSPYEFDAAQLAVPRTGGRLESFDDSLAISNNQCFGRLAVRDVGRAALLAEIERVGLLTPPAFGHSAGSFDPVENSLALGRLGSGLAGSSLSPLAAARLAAVLAHGELVEPHWIAGVRDTSGALIAVPEFAAPRRVWEPEVAVSLRRSLRGVTERGTARRAFRDAKGKPLLGDIAVAGKTGTLQGENPNGLYQWFVGVAPAEDPRIAIATLVVHEQGASRHRGGAGTNASHVAAQTLHGMLCDREGCATDRIDPLFARASARRAESVAELEAQRTAREQARMAAERVEPPRLLESSDIEFPRALRRRQVEGEIVLAVSLAPSGEIANIRVQESNVSKRFDEPVTEAVRGWRFAPSTRGGQPVAGEVRLRIPIQIR